MNWTRQAGLASLALIFLSGVTLSSEGSELKEIMQELRSNLVDISDGLLTDDFEQVARGASAIARHPKIPAVQVQLVAAELGAEMPAFKQFDKLVHDVSIEIDAAAKLADRDAVISGYQQLIEGCLACHSAYKERVAAALAAGADSSNGS